MHLDGLSSRLTKEHRAVIYREGYDDAGVSDGTISN
jgi:hypothetical protein